LDRRQDAVDAEGNIKSVQASDDPRVRAVDQGA
jgi:hypothetical protein